METQGLKERLLRALGPERGFYAWQLRLLDDWIEGRRWDALDVPTGLGKTSVLTLWLIARALGAAVPRRLIYVVDRRAVVDQASAEAVKLAGKLDCFLDSDSEGSAVREQLGLRRRPKRADGEPDTWLPISTLRGQTRDNRRWFEDPAACAIVVGTVDMIGSRLLFEGYGVSRWMRPVHAGLIGLDSLVVLDEAHLVPPFKALVRQASDLAGEDHERVMGTGQAVLPAPLQLMALSATGRPSAGEQVFKLERADHEDPPVAARLAAPKRLRVLAEATPDQIAQRLADQAWDYRLSADGRDGRRVLVYCNSRVTAQKVAADLAGRASGKKGAYGPKTKLVELLVGERRYPERLTLTGDPGLGVDGSPVFQRFLPGAAPEEHPAFLVATSAGEVGVDLDADDLVCDLVAWERMVQRLGRVNRRAEPGEARVAVIPVAKEKEAEDPVEDVDLARWRAPFDSPFWREGEDGARDASPAGLTALRELARRTPALAEVLDAATTPEPLRPPLTRPTLESWSLTSLEQHPGRPKVGPWLRGWEERERPQTTVVWRRLFPIRRDEPPLMSDLRAFFAAAPPHPTESLEAPTWRVSALLRERATAMRKAEQKRRRGEAADTEPDLPDDEADEPEPSQSDLAQAVVPAAYKPGHEPLIVVLAADRSVVRVYTRRELEQVKDEVLQRDLAYGAVVLDARLGGLDETGLLDSKVAEPPRTLDDEPTWPLPLERTAGRRITLGKEPGGDRRHWKVDEFRWSTNDADDPLGIWVELWRGPGDNPGDAAVSRTAQALFGDGGHLSDTAREAGRIADGLGLADPWRAVLVAGAAAHDLGKARDLWQDAMGAPRDRPGAPKQRPYAKTTGGGDWRALNGYRHEFGSVLDVLAAPADHLPPEILADPELTDLALHLIAAHHGRARPIIPAYDPAPQTGPPSRSAAHAREIALRFARLQTRWGPWGLAWWEALLRAADWAASRQLNERGESEGEPAAEAPVLERADG